jgi:methionine sulfoxide reductase heme-binding subunit
VTGLLVVDHGWWLASRAAGIVAILLLSASLLLGLLLATRTAPARWRPRLGTAHERLSLVALGALAAHGAFLLGDAWLHPGAAGLLVPFAMDYRPFFTGLGVLAGYLAVALGLSYYARRRVGARRWRSAHRFIPVAWALAAIHVLGAGTDAGSAWLQAPIVLTAVLGGGLLAVRLARPRLRAGARRAPEGSARAAA